MSIINKEVKSDFWSKEVLVSDVSINEDNIIRISYSEKDNKKFINIRKFFRSDDEFIPTKSGLSIKVDDKEDNIITGLSESLNFISNSLLK